MRVRAPLVLLLVALFASNVHAQLGTTTDLVPSRAELRVDNAGPTIDGQLTGSSWQVNARIPEPRGAAQGSIVAANDGSVIYSIGGGCCNPQYPEAFNRVWAYSPSDDSWSAVADIPISEGIRSYGAAVEFNGFIYVFGGLTGPGLTPTILNTTWVYDEANDFWYQGANMPSVRAASAVATDGAVIWVIGGYQGLGLFDTANTVWMYDPTTDTYSTGFADIPQNLARIKGALLTDGNLHVLGGHWDMNDHWVYSTVTDTWFSAPLMPAEVVDPAVATDGTRIYVAGDNGAVPRPPGHLRIYDPANQLWSDGPLMPPPAINNTSGTIANSTLYVMGGYDGATLPPVNYSLSLVEFSGLGP